MTPKIKVAPEIFLAPNRKHAWLALKVVEANAIAGRWFNEFRLTKSDIDKLDYFKSG